MGQPERELLQSIAAPLERYPEGSTPTCVPFLQVIRRSRPAPFTPGMLTPSFCLVLQGQKRLHLGTRVLEYGPGQFISALMEVPAAGVIVAASPRRPYLGIRMDLSMEDLAAVVADAKLSVPREAEPSEAAVVGRAGPELLEVHLRLVQLLARPREAEFMSGLLKRELIFRLLTGEHGHFFLRRALLESGAGGIASAIAWIRGHFRSTFTMAQLARSNGLSVSALHHKFKAVTTMSPLQYQKQLRLQEARRLMIAGQVNASLAAMEVGYESVSQFSREYRRHFGLPPRADVAALRERNAGPMLE